MTNLLQELLEISPLAFKWHDKTRCVFQSNEKHFGIFLEFFSLELGRDGRTVAAVNVVFGTIDEEKSKSFSVRDIDMQITNFGSPRTILSTVANACLANPTLVNCDIIALAAADNVKDKRARIYALAATEIKSKNAEFSKHREIRVKNAEGQSFVLLTKLEFTEAEKQEVIFGFSK